jgi:hypothetical protein
MGATPSREAQVLRADLQAPLTGAAAAAAGVLGTYALDVEMESPTCGSAYKSSPIWCCCGREEFRVPWPCHCCGANCLCCPHAPHGEAWESALAGGFRAQLKEAGHMVARSAEQRYSALGADGRPVSDVQQNVLVANARRLLLQGWVAQANAYLAPFGLETRAYNWVEERRDDKGNKTGEVLRCALQFYERSASQAPLLLLAGGSGAVAPYPAPPPQVALGGPPPPAGSAPQFYPPPQQEAPHFYPPPRSPQQQQQQQQQYYQSAGAPKTV